MTRPSSPIPWSVAALLAAATASAQPRVAPIPETTLLAGSPLHLALDGTDPTGASLSFTATVSDPLVTARVLTGNRSLRLRVQGFGELVFELFDGRARRATDRIANLASSGFYGGVVFHRIVDGFVIQGGDPTGTGAGGSPLGPFADQFHVELQHNRTGLLSMAKAGDDTNDSQFFITEGPQRHLDFNHSIFGLLVEGESVREAISLVPVDEGSRPLNDVVIESAETFVDSENGVLVLSAPEGATGAVDVTVAVRNDAGVETTTTFRVNVTPDTVNSPPFLADVPELTTSVGVPLTHQLVARDAEGDPAFFLDEAGMVENGLAVPVPSHADLDYTVDFESGLLTVTPKNGLSGRHRISIAAAVTPAAVDYQVVTVVIGEAPSSP